MTEPGEARMSGGNRLFGCFIVVGLFILMVGFAGILYYTSSGRHISNLSSENVEKRRFAADQLIEKGEAAGKPALKAATDKTLDRETRRLAIFVLGQIRYPDAKEPLLAIMRDEAPLLRQQAAYSLGRLSDPSLLPELEAAYRSGDKGLKAKIIFGLGEAKGEAAKAGLPLLEAAAKSDDEFLRAAAELAIDKVKKEAGR